MIRAPEGFALGRSLGEGYAFATFEVARDRELFVCKRLTSRTREEPSARLALANDARILEALRGGNAPKLVQVGEDAAGPFVVMEQVAYPTLRAHGANGRARRAARDDAGDAGDEGDEGNAAWIARAVRATFAALAAIHEARDARGPLAIVHADVSPDNVTIAEAGDAATFLDFGLAETRDTHARDAGASPFRGTMLYASPELARGEPIDARADLFALAASWLHVWSGEPPHAPIEVAPLLLAAAEDSLAPYAARAARGLPADVARILTTCTAFAPEDRPASARAALA